MSFEELPGHRWLCPYCYKYGYIEPKCFRKQRNQAPAQQPSLEEIQKRYEIYKERRKEKKVMNKIEKVGDEPEALETNEEKGEEVELFRTSFKMVRRDGEKYDFNLVQGDAEVEVRLSGSKRIFVALLDSGAFRSAINMKLREYCSKTVEFRQPLRVTIAGGEKYVVKEYDYIDNIEVKLDGKYFNFQNVPVMILYVALWDNLIIGNDVLRAHGLDPISALKQKMSHSKQVNMMKRENMGKEVFLDDELNKVELEIEGGGRNIFGVRIPDKMCGNEPGEFLEE
eukprot:snap_masked-scaffold_4-processed-gene-9.6-mRNA-1 protein AED:1.00 eAED:1.00 QI:0/0/0/0/1/1/2/0/282